MVFHEILQATRVKLPTCKIIPRLPAPVPPITMEEAPRIKPRPPLSFANWSLALQMHRWGIWFKFKAGRAAGGNLSTLDESHEKLGNYNSMKLQSHRNPQRGR